MANYVTNCTYFFGTHAEKILELIVVEQETVIMDDLSRNDLRYRVSETKAHETCGDFRVTRQDFRDLKKIRHTCIKSQNARKAH